MELIHSPLNRLEQASHLLDDLRQDHELLYGELAALKKAENFDGPPLWQTLQKVCARLSVRLRDHMGREEPLLRVTHPHSLGAAASETMSWPVIDHYSDYRYLQVITRSIALENRPFLLNNRYHLLTDFISRLHHNMNKQETDLFPFIEQAMAGKTEKAIWND